MSYFLGQYILINYKLSNNQRKGVVRISISYKIST
jgi:hypothetical protein